jgi:hypothetical protein
MPLPTEGLEGWWHCLALGSDGNPVWLAVLPATHEHGDGVRLELPESEATAALDPQVMCVARYVDGEVSELSVSADVAPKAPPLWFADLPEPTATPPTATIIAFTGHGIAAGTLIDRSGLRELGITSEDQLGALRWYPNTGEIDQIYVAPAWRRRNIATATLVAAGTLSVARHGSRLWADGQRTAMGERLRNADTWTHRAADLTHIHPPMTPFDER